MASKAIPRKVEKSIYQEANSTCPFCGERDISVLLIHHIHQQSDGGKNDPQNLILTCANCHSKIHSGEIDVKTIFQKKIELISGKQPSSSTSNIPRQSITVADSVNSGIIGNTVNIKTTKRTIKILPPNGSIASDGNKRNYVKYLIDRYHEYKKAHEARNMNYAMFYSAIKKKFGAKWDMILLEKFDLLCNYIKRRIDSTIFGKNNRSKEIKNYSSFQEFIEKS